MKTCSAFLWLVDVFDLVILEVARELKNVSAPAIEKQQ